MSSPTNQTELEALSALVGAPVVAAERSPWGFENRTDIVTLHDGERRVVQRISNRDLAAHKLRLAERLPERLAAAGLRAPRVLRADAAATPPYAVREYLEGAPGSTLLDNDHTAIHLAQAMGALLPRIAAVPTDGLGLHRIWADPARLAAQATKQLAQCTPLLSAMAVAALAATIHDAPALLAGRPAVFAHGDYAPVNVLVAPEGERWSVVALLDLEFARVADPLFDAAWWGWVVRYHHPERWQVAWPHLLAAAGIEHATEARRITTIQRLRCLEALHYYAATSSAAGAHWAARLEHTLAWE